MNGSFPIQRMRTPDPERTIEPSAGQRQVTERSGRAASWLNANCSAFADVQLIWAEGCYVPHCCHWLSKKADAKACPGSAPGRAANRPLKPVVIPAALDTSFRSLVLPILRNQRWRFCPWLLDQRILEPLLA
jgi:hypothetical protein